MWNQKSQSSVNVKLVQVINAQIGENVLCRSSQGCRDGPGPKEGRSKIYNHCQTRRLAEKRLRAYRFLQPMFVNGKSDGFRKQDATQGRN